MVKSKYADKNSGFLKTKKVSLIIIMLPNEVDGDGGDDGGGGGDDGGGGSDDGRRYFPLIFLLFTSYFSLFF